METFLCSVWLVPFKELSTDEVELRELTDSTLNKLSAMSDEDYANMELYPDFDE